MNPIGVMQGRLLPKYQGRYQAHPVGYWSSEFAIARRFGLDCIEFILDFNEAECNPLLRDGGLDEIHAAVERSGVRVLSVCADYFMERPLHSPDEALAAQSIAVLRRVLRAGRALGVSDIVIPCVDHASLSNRDDRQRLVAALQTVLDAAEEAGINLSLETDLAPHAFGELLACFEDGARVTVNYDIGNSAALGYDLEEELDVYGSRITDIHIKDRQWGGGPVMLGSGAADFQKFFRKLAEFDYRGPFVMQAYRDDEGLGVFQRQLG